MPRPTSSTTVARPDLAGPLMEYQDDQFSFVADQIMPFVGVQEKNGTYPVIPIEALLEMPDDIKRRPRGNYSRGDYEFENDNYDCSEYGWEEPVDDSEVRLYARYFDAEKIAAIRAYNIVKRAREKRVADMLFNASNFTANAVTHEWDDGTNAVPIDDVATGIASVRSACGVVPNALVITYKTFLDLGVCDSIVDRIKYTDPNVKRGQLSTAQLAMAFGVEQVIVAGGAYNSAKKGQSASVADIWSQEYAMLCRVSNSPDVTAPCIGRTFKWEADCSENQMVESYRDEGLRSDIIRVRQNVDEELILTACAYLLSNIYTTA